MSLYGGIKFSDGQVKSQAGGTASGSDPAAAPASSNGNPSRRPLAGPSSSTSLSSAAPDRVKPAPVSAALTFAPRINKPKPAASRPATSTHANANASAAAAPTPLPPPSAGIVRSAEPVLIGAAGGSKAESEVVFGKDGKPLARAPAMVLGAKKAGGWKNQADDAARKRKKKKKRRAPLLHTFDPEEQYDPNRPNDLGEYQEYRKRVREERRAKFMESRRRKLAGESSEGSSDDSDSEAEVAPRRDAPKMWAPPKQYSPPPSAAPPPLAPPPPPSAQSGDDAYARRLAMAQAASGDDAYARRAALSQQAPPPPPSVRPPPPPSSHPPPPPSFHPPPPPSAHPPPPPSSHPPPPPPVHPAFPPPPPSGESQPPPSHFPPPPAGPAPSYIPGFGAHTARPPPPRPFIPPPANLVAAAPVPSAPPAMRNFPPSLPPQGGPSRVPAFVPAPPTATPAVPAPEQAEFARQLEEKKKALAAIAAKFSTLPGAKAAPEPFEEKEGESFAEKMMRKWGHKEGKGLGSRQEGITEALVVEHVAVDPKNPAQMSKRQLAKQKMAAANAKTSADNKKWVQHAAARGKVVNVGEENRQREEKEKYGEPSRVVCLVGVVDDLEEVDEDLSEEIGEECSKYGIVERVVLHMVEPQPDDPAEALRVFVVFSGMAGAWRSLKELDGRFFGGRKIRATYFDEAKFDAGERDGPIL